MVCAVASNPIQAVKSSLVEGSLRPLNLKKFF
ncbi:hypothetical protein, partial [uncultured Gammaproteobacteria bacterium]